MNTRGPQISIKGKRGRSSWFLNRESRPKSINQLLDTAVAGELASREAALNDLEGQQQVARWENHRIAEAAERSRIAMNNKKMMLLRAIDVPNWVRSPDIYRSAVMEVERLSDQVPINLPSVSLVRYQTKKTDRHWVVKLVLLPIETISFVFSAFNKIVNLFRLSLGDNPARK